MIVSTTKEVIEMNIPGFSAEASLSRTGVSYRLAESYAEMRTTVVPAFTQMSGVFAVDYLCKIAKSRGQVLRNQGVKSCNNEFLIATLKCKTSRLDPNFRNPNFRPQFSVRCCRSIFPVSRYCLIRRVICCLE